MKIYVVRENLGDEYTFSCEYVHGIFGKKCQADKCLLEVMEERLKYERDSDVYIDEQEIRC